MRNSNPGFILCANIYLKGSHIEGGQNYQKKKKKEIKLIIISARNSINYFPLGLRVEEHQDITFCIVILVI